MSNNATLCRRKTCTCECSLPEYGGFCSAGCQSNTDPCSGDKQGRHNRSTTASAPASSAAPPAAAGYNQQQQPAAQYQQAPPVQYNNNHQQQQQPAPAAQHQQPAPQQMRAQLSGPVQGNAYTNPYAGGGSAAAPPPQHAGPSGVPPHQPSQQQGQYNPHGQHQQHPAHAGHNPQQQQYQHPGSPPAQSGNNNKKQNAAPPEPLRNDPCKYDKFYPALEYGLYTEDELNGKYKHLADRAATCLCCKAEFGAFRWKHRCRLSACVVCDDCAPKADGFIPDSSVRICKICELNKLGVVPKSGIAKCATERCMCESYNGMVGERCCRHCQPGRYCPQREHMWKPSEEAQESRRKAEKWQRDRNEWLAQNPNSNNAGQPAAQRGGGGGVADLQQQQQSRPSGGGGGSHHHHQHHQQQPQPVDASLNARHGNSNHPLASCPTKLIDDYLLNNVAPRIQAGKLHDQLTDSNIHPFTDEQPPPVLSQLSRYLPQIPPMTGPAPSYAQEISKIVDVVDADTLVHARALHQTGKYKNVAFLNMANAFWVGGGWSVAIGAQEEYLFRNSTLSLALWKHRAPQQDGYRPWKIGGKILGSPSSDPSQVFYPLSKYATIFTRKVEVFALQDKMLPPNQVFECAALSMAAQDLRPPKGSPHGTPNLPFDANLNLQKIRGLLFTALLYGCDALVLGSIGSGVFRCDPVQMASLFRQALEELHGSFPPGQYPFKKVDFAILGGGNNMQAYQQVLMAP